MKIQYKNQEFQTHAVNAVVDLFAGQENAQSNFAMQQSSQLHLFENEFGIGNTQLIPNERLLKNMQDIQKRNALTLSSDVDKRQFCIEMETGTGKTYVYTKSIFELNKRYGFCKFIIVVPSVAIREGVYKSFQMTQEHFALQYDNVPCRYFIYDSKKLSDVRQFATSPYIEVMIINIDAFKKAENIIHKEQDSLNGETAMEYIQNTRPIVIIDEPQSVDNTPKSREAIASLQPLCNLRYSATHRDKTNLLYKLTPVDAYQTGLVKQISVASHSVLHDFNRPYIRLLEVSQAGGFKAKIELDVENAQHVVTRKKFTIKATEDLFKLSGEREIYKGYKLAGIDCTPDFERIEFVSGEKLAMGQAIGNIDEAVLTRAQIRYTIKKHLEKEQRYREKGIKVLSLFFIDEVKKYRGEDGKTGIYAEIFEECYNELIVLPEFNELRKKLNPNVSLAHNGYFSQDKKGIFKDTRGNTNDDNQTYQTIMKDKEWLLSFDCPLRFIFSHSALKEGWDNPNVFQVCTLIQQKSTFTCRQKIGRGLRLSINQNGERIEDKNINVLHVVANESFAEFASSLQREIENDTGMKFGVLQLNLFQGMVYEERIETEKTLSSDEAVELFAHLKENSYVDEDGYLKEEAKQALENQTLPLPQKFKKIESSFSEQIDTEKPIEAQNLANISYVETVLEEKIMDHEGASELMDHFVSQKYIDKKGAVKDTMKQALLQGTLDLPKKYEAARTRLEEIIQKSNTTPPLRDASRDVMVKLKNQVIESEEFKELWNKMKQKTAYRVNLDNKIFIDSCVQKFKEMPKLPKASILTQSADIHMQNQGVSHIQKESRAKDLAEERYVIPDILLFMQENCGIPFNIAQDILLQSERLEDFLRNPQLFSEHCLQIVKSTLNEFEVAGIYYLKLEGEEYSSQEIFDAEELLANLDKNAISVDHSVYDHIIYDSTSVERPFAIALDNDPDVKMFFKIPDHFTIPTPIGSYNPDWAVYIKNEEMEKLFFIIESKGSTDSLDLRGREDWKIQCGKKHFDAIKDDMDLHVAKDWREFKNNLSR